MDNKIIDNNWVVYVNVTNEERIKINNTAQRLPFKFTEGDCLSDICKTYLLNNVDPLLVFVGGSVLTGITDFYSDYDLSVLTKDTVKLDNSNFVIFRGRHIHPYIHTMDSLIEVVKDDIIHSVGLIKFSFLTRDKIIYTTLSEDIVSDLLNHLGDLTQAGITTFDDYCRDYIEEVIGLGKVGFNGPVKLLGTALEIHHILKGEPLDKDKNYILKVKRLKKSGFTGVDISRLVNDLKEYCILVDEYRKTHTYEDAINNWKSSFAYQEIKKLSENQ